MIVKFGTYELEFDSNTVQRYQRLTGDTDEILIDVVRLMIEAETGLDFEYAVRNFPKENIKAMVEERMLSELSGFVEE